MPQSLITLPMEVSRIVSLIFIQFTKYLASIFIIIICELNRVAKISW